MVDGHNTCTIRITKRTRFEVRERSNTRMQLEADKGYIHCLRLSCALHCR
jgi:hypothetical protein